MNDKNSLIIAGIEGGLKNRLLKIPQYRLNFLNISNDIPPKDIGCPPAIGISLCLQASLDNKPITSENIKEFCSRIITTPLSEKDIYNVVKSHVKVSILKKWIKSCEPSTIFTTLPIEEPKFSRDISRPGYYNLCYAWLNKEQRWLFLKMLEDPLKPTSRAYIDLYLYCLERQIFDDDNYMNAIKEIMLLVNGNFYLRDSQYHIPILFFSYINWKDDEILKILVDEMNKYPITNYGLLLRFVAKRPLLSKDIFELLCQMKDINKRYLKLKPSLYMEFLDNFLMEKYGIPEYRFYSNIRIDDVPLIEVRPYTNYSFPNEIKIQTIKNLIDYLPFINDLKIVHSKIHLKIKNNKINYEGQLNSEV
jgi:hypothetical protein